MSFGDVSMFWRDPLTILSKLLSQSNPQAAASFVARGVELRLADGTMYDNLRSVAIIIAHM